MKNLLSTSLLLVLPCAVLLSCHRHRHDDDYNGTSTIYEQEPNGNFSNPDFIGSVVPGDRINIDGHIDNDGSDDFDGFAFIAARPVVVEFELWADNPFADLDLLVYDPDFDDFPFAFTSGFNPEDGSFSILTAGQEFHMVVDSDFGESSYFLEIRFYEPNLALGLATDGDQPISDFVLLRERPQRGNAVDLSRSSYLRSQAPEPEALAPLLDVDSGLQITIDEQGEATVTEGLLIRPEKR